MLWVKKKKGLGVWGGIECNGGVCFGLFVIFNFVFNRSFAYVVGLYIFIIELECVKHKHVDCLFIT